MNPSLRIEEMSPAFTKIHIDGLPFAMVAHRFTGPDHGPFHDHPYPFQSHILWGGYEEEILDVRTGDVTRVERHPGTSHRVEASHVHRITRLLDGECWTSIVLPFGLPALRTGFFEWRENGLWHRFWDEPEFRRVAS